MFNFLNGLGNLKSNIEQYLQPAENMVSGVLSQYFPSKSQSFRPDASAKPANVLPLLRTIDKAQGQPQTRPQTPQEQYQQPQQPQPVQQPIPQPGDFQQGFQNFSPSTPASTASAAFSKAAASLPPSVDPYLPAIIALMETGGGSNSVANNNLFNLSGIQNGQPGFVDYPDMTTALLGGNNNGVQSQGFIGTILNNPAYAPFLKSGDLNDFFKVYTPPGAQYGNPDMGDLLSRYASLRSLFPSKGR